MWCNVLLLRITEDILKRDQAIWVSPDATKIVYATFNDSQVQNVQWKIYGDGRDASVNPYPKEAYMRYPKGSITAKLYLLFLERAAVAWLLLRAAH